MKRFSSMFVLAIVSFLSLQAYAAPAYIIILRHGEKNSDESRHLSPKGYRRATALAKQFSSSAFEKRFGRPAALFSASDEGDRSKRSVETLEPSAKALSLKIDNSFVKGDEHELIEAIRKDENLDGKTVVISWSHTSIPRFLKQFDIEGKKKKDWDGDVYDRFWILENLPKGKWDFRQVDQAALPGDRGYCTAKIIGRAHIWRRPKTSN